MGELKHSIVVLVIDKSLIPFFLGGGTYCPNMKNVINFISFLAESWSRTFNPLTSSAPKVKNRPFQSL